MKQILISALFVLCLIQCKNPKDQTSPVASTDSTQIHPNTIGLGDLLACLSFDLPHTGAYLDSVCPQWSLQRRDSVWLNPKFNSMLKKSGTGRILYFIGNPPADEFQNQLLHSGFSEVPSESKLAELDTMRIYKNKEYVVVYHSKQTPPLKKKTITVIVQKRLRK